MSRKQRLEVGGMVCEAVGVVAIGQEKLLSFSTKCNSNFLGSPGRKKCMVS